MALRIYDKTLFEARPAAVVFDFDNTMYPYDEANSAGMSAVAAKAVSTLSLSEDEFKAAFDEARRLVKDSLGHTASAHSRLLYFQRTFEVLGLKSQVFLALDFEQAYWRTFLAHQHLFPEAKEFVEDVKACGIPTAITTDLTSQIQFRKLVYTGLDRLFDYVVTSEEAGRDKPHPEMFQAVLRKFGSLHGPVWMIGDDLKKDMRGAKEVVGAKTFLRCGSLPPSRPECVDCAFTRFSEIRKSFSRLAPP